MELTKKELLVFNYQLKILEKLYPSQATFFAKKHNTLNDGFVTKYRNMADFLFGELSEEDCLEVLNILDMYTAITSSLLKLEKSDNLHYHPFAKFNGFDGNNEGNRMAYVQIYMYDLDRFKEMRSVNKNSYNSGTPMLKIYRKMFQIWEGLGKDYNLSKAQIANVLGD